MKSTDIFETIRGIASVGVLAARLIARFGEDEAKDIIQWVIDHPPSKADLQPIRDAAAKRRAELEAEDTE